MFEAKVREAPDHSAFHAADLNVTLYEWRGERCIIFILQVDILIDLYVINYNLFYLGTH